MPKVGSREFDYTPGGIAHAQNYARKTGQSVTYRKGVTRPPVPMPKKSKGGKSSGKARKK